jgi:hypothetical protein
MQVPARVTIAAAMRLFAKTRSALHAVAEQECGADMQA